MKQSKTVVKDISVPDELNVFSARFKQNASGTVSPALTAPDMPVPFITAADVGSVFLGVKPRKVTGLDRVPAVHLDPVWISWWRKKGGEHSSICINGAEFERVDSINFLG
eukprot:g40175.t1